MKRRVCGHHRLDAVEVFRVYRTFQLADFRLCCESLRGDARLHLHPATCATHALDDGLKRRVTGHQPVRLLPILLVEGSLKSSGSDKLFDVGLEFRPARKAVTASDLELRVG
jgi:hypothetical protein